MKRYVMTAFLLGIAGVLCASVIFYKNKNSTSPRVNPADPKAGSFYQGYITSNKTQSLILLNAAAVSAGSTHTLQLSNMGWKPKRYKISEDPALASAVWLEMPASRVLTFDIAGSNATNYVYTLFELPDNSTYPFTNVVLYLFNSAPTASFVISPTNVGNVTMAYLFNASASSDPENNIATYNWDFNGDAVVDVSVSSNRYTTNYTVPGTYTVTLTVVDAYFSSNSTVKNITITNSAPVASFTISPSNTGSKTNWFVFDSSATADVDNNIASNTWDFNNDGVFEVSITSNTYARKFTALGTNWITLKVYDAYNAVSVVSNFILLTNVLEGVFVATNGNDTNNGLSFLSPVKTIQLGITIAVQSNLSNVFVGTGAYTSNSGLNAGGEKSGVWVTNDNIKLSGGWDSTFSTNTNYSVLDGSNTLWHCVAISNVSNVSMSGFILQKGATYYSGENFNKAGGGLYMSNVQFSSISNSVICSNSADQWGGGIYCANGISNIFNVQVYGNSCNLNSGGGVNINNSAGIVFNGLISNNTSSGFSWGGGIYMTYCTNSVIGAVVAKNYGSGNGGGGISLWYCAAIAITNQVFGNYTWTSRSGGGIYIESSSNVTVSGPVYSNIASNLGGGVCISSSSKNTISGPVFDNYTSVSGGGVYISGCSNIINGAVYNNTAGTSGGGIYISSSSSYSNTISGAITNNSPYGVYCYDAATMATNKIIITGISNNTPEDIYPVLFLGSIVYVATNGNDTNCGIKKYPVRSLQRSLAVAMSNNVNTVYVGEGLYNTNAGLNLTNEKAGVWITNNNMIFVGGWDSSFSSHLGYSELDGGNVCHVIAITNVTNIRMEGFLIRGGYAASSPDNAGGGVFCSNVSYCIITNCMLSNNYAQNNGGGIGIKYGISNLIDASLINNISDSSGSGLGLYYSIGNTISGVFSNNICYGMGLGGGGVAIGYGNNNTVTALLISNRATSSGMGGGGIALYFTTNNIVSSMIASNSVDGYGGGVYFYDSPYNTIVGTIFKNTAKASGGGGVYINSANSYSNTISGTITEHSQYGVYFYSAATKTTNTIIMTGITNNTPGDTN